MKTVPVPLLLAMWISVYSGCGPNTDVSPDLAVAEDTEARTPLEPDVVHDLVEHDMPPELQIPPDVAPSFILPGSSCLGVTPDKVSFGGVKVGDLKTVPVTVTACGATPLRIDGIYLADGAAPAFSLDLSSLPHPPTPEQPLVLHPGDEVKVPVGFMMETPSTVKDDGGYIVEEAELVVESTGVPKYFSAPLTGVAVVAICPTAIITCSEGDGCSLRASCICTGTRATPPMGQL